MSNCFPKFGLIIALAVAAVFTSLNIWAAPPIYLNLTSNASWKSNDTFFPGWEQPGFDDSAWNSARAPYPAAQPPETLLPGTDAEFMWDDPNGISDGKTGPIEAFFRLEFDLDIHPDSLPLLGQAIMFVDDDFEFFVNGQSVFFNGDDGKADVPHFVDFTDKLQSGTNVFAIQAVDGCWDRSDTRVPPGPVSIGCAVAGGPHDRIYEVVLFDSTIETVGVGVDHSHSYLTGKGKGHNNTPAHTGPAVFPATD